MANLKRYEVPDSLSEVTQIVTEGSVTLFAGGTDVLPQTRAGAREFQRALVNINRLAELRGISASGGTVRIGALTTITDILDSGFLAKHDKNRKAQPEPTSVRNPVKRGIGMASLLHVGGGAKIYRSDGCGTILKLDDHAHATVITGSTDIGQGF